MSTTSRPLTRDSVLAAHGLVKPHIHRTPMLTNTTLNTLASTPQTAEALKGTQWEGQTPSNAKFRLFFKCENLQRIGAFKVRGAFHAVTRLIEELGLEEVRKRGVVTHSSGTSFILQIPTYICCLQDMDNRSGSKADPPKATTPKPSPSPPAPSRSPHTSSCRPYPRPPKSPAPRRKTHMYISAAPQLPSAKPSSQRSKQRRVRF